MEKRSKRNVVHSALDVKSWNAAQPSVASIRPACCPACNTASRPDGGPLIVWGHGTHERTIWGPPTASGAPVQIVVRLQRFLCRACNVTCTVVPQGVATRYRYGAFAIALAFALWGLENWPPGAVRAAISPWQLVGASQCGRWRSLARWAGDALEGRLFRGLALHRSFAAGPARAIATRVAQLAASRAPPSDRSLDLRHRVWRGGAAMA